MKFFISSFYYVRFLPDNYYPISTCMWDPKWFNNFKGQGQTYIDKRNVVNGLRCTLFNLPEEYWNTLVKQGHECRKDCPFKEHLPCLFMNQYGAYLNSLNFNDVVHNLLNIAKQGQQINKTDKEINIVLLVAESVDCPCAERPVIVKWFKDHATEITEIDKNNCKELK